jgi:hypothetical protein
MMYGGVEVHIHALLTSEPEIKTYRTIILSVVLYGCETSSLTLREGYLRVSEKIFGTEREEVAED